MISPSTVMLNDEGPVPSAIISTVLSQAMLLRAIPIATKSTFPWEHRYCQREGVSPSQWICIRSIPTIPKNSGSHILTSCSANIGISLPFWLAFETWFSSKLYSLAHLHPFSTSMRRTSLVQLDFHEANVDWYPVQIQVFWGKGSHKQPMSSGKCTST